MNQFFKDHYYKYFLWNKGLIEYYLSDDKSKEDIKLYIDEAVLAKVGRKIGIGKYSEDKEYTEDFMESVENFCNYYNRYDNYYRCPLPLRLSTSRGEKPEEVAKKSITCTIAKLLGKCNHPNNNCIKMQILKEDDGSYVKYRQDFLVIAKHIASKDGGDKGIYYCPQSDEFIYIKNIEGKIVPYELPFFAIVVYIILRFDEQEILKWDNLSNRIYEKSINEEGQIQKKSCKSYLKIASASRGYINYLWECIHRKNKRFKKEASIFVRDEQQRNDYVGKIRYHIPLSSPLRRRINDAIYMSGIWDCYDSMSFREQMYRIKEQIPENKKDELSRIFTECLTNEKYREIYKNRIKYLLDKFDPDLYRAEIEKRKSENSNESTRVKGYFTLAILNPTIESGIDPEIRLYTTIPQELNVGDYGISEESFSINGYNGNPVKYKGTTSVKIDEYKFKKGSTSITAISDKFDVIFFYTHDREDESQLYFQTEELIPAKSYFIVVKDDENIIDRFEQWCKENGNKVEKQNKEGTEPLFGKEWIIYYKRNGCWNGQYYKRNVETEGMPKDDDENVELRLSFQNNDGNHFINSLPYFEIPERYKIEDIKVYINFENYESVRPANDNEYQILYKGRKLIIDLKDTSNIGFDFRCSVSLEYDKNIISPPCDIKVSGQDITFQQDKLYKFNKLGKISDDNDFAVSGNTFATNSGKRAEGGYSISGLSKLEQVPDNAYLVNLLAAVCYDKDSAEIRPADFKKCVSYANTRLKGMEEIPMSSIEHALVTAGFINIDYSRNPKRYQIVPPAFTRVPRSIDGCGTHQLYMLTGAYTKTFLDDLISYSNNNGIDIYSNSQDVNHYSWNNLLPSPILIGYNFDPKDFLEKYPHQCDVFEDQDLAYSLLSNVTYAQKVFDAYKFHKNNDADFLFHLEDPKDSQLPRLRKDKNVHFPNWYIEKENNYFCSIDKSMLDWAFLFCYLKRFKTFMVVDQENRNTIYLPHSLQLPWMVRRSIYMMNLGQPAIVSVFVCSSGRDLPYQIMDKFVLTSKERTNLLSEILVLSKDQVRDSQQKRNYKMEFWRSKQKFGKNYIVLKDERKDLVAIAYKRNVTWDVFINDRDDFKKLDGSFNEVMSFLIREKWSLNPNPTDEPHKPHTSVGTNKDYIYTSRYTILDDTIELPYSKEFEIRHITII